MTLLLLAPTSISVFSIAHAGRKNGEQAAGGSFSSGRRRGGGGGTRPQQMRLRRGRKRPSVAADVVGKAEVALAPVHDADGAGKGRIRRNSWEDLLMKPGKWEG